MAVEYLARQKALAAPEVQNDDELKATGTKELAAAKEQLEKALKRAYQHVAYLAQPDPDGDRYLDQVTFDDEHSSPHSTARSSGRAWPSATRSSTPASSPPRHSCTTCATSDYGRTLSDIRAAFYSAPRLPLLVRRRPRPAAGDLRRRQRGPRRDRRRRGVPVAVTAPAQVNLSSTGLRLAKPQPAEPVPSPGTGGGDNETTGGHDQTPSGGGVNDTPGSPGAPTAPTPAATERQITFSFTQNLLANQSSADDLANAFKTLYTALDERNISYLQATVQMVGDAKTVDGLKSLLDQVGIHANVKDM